MLIAILLDGGPAADASARKLTLLVDQQGAMVDVRVGWPASDDNGLLFGPILQITPDEWLRQLQIAQGVGL